MTLPASDEVRDLLAWEPEHGVLSIVYTVDHGDRGGGWRIALLDALRETVATEQVEGRDAKLALRDTSERLRRRFPEDVRPPDGRVQIGLVEISRGEDGREQWWSTNAAPRQGAIVVADRRPYLQPLIEILDEERCRGIVTITGERARVLEWNEGAIAELADEEILMTGDWRETKGPRQRDIPRGQTVTSSGRDQYDQRVEDHRHRFVEEIAEQIGKLEQQRSWPEILLFGETKYLSELRRRLPEERISHSEDKNLINASDAEIAERLRELNEPLNRRREIALLEQAEGHAQAGGRGSLGLIETAQALAEGRVQHLLLDSVALDGPPPPELVQALSVDGQNGVLATRTGEVLIERALLTGAAITPVEGEAAERLQRHGGAAALLRY
jgi:hypothetical protein